MKNTSWSCFGARIFDVCFYAELEIRRRGHHNRTIVRDVAGFSSMRWYDSVQFANGYVFVQAFYVLGHFPG